MIYHKYMTDNIDNKSLLGACLSWLLILTHNLNIGTILQNISLILAIIVSIDTLTGNILRTYLLKKIKKIFKIKNKNENEDN